MSNHAAAPPLELYFERSQSALFYPHPNPLPQGERGLKEVAINGRSKYKGVGSVCSVLSVKGFYRFCSKAATIP